MINEDVQKLEHISEIILKTGVVQLLTIILCTFLLLSVKHLCAIITLEYNTDSLIDCRQLIYKEKNSEKLQH